jgi:divalent metal cation (Fe/Co/Zn/Cd) transporter
MPQKYTDGFAWLGLIVPWLVDHSFYIGVSVMTFTISLLQTVRNGKLDVIEALLCTFIALGLSLSLKQFNLDSSFAYVIAVFLGSMGSQWFRKNAAKAVDAKLNDFQAQLESIKKGSDDAPSQ